MEDNFNEALLKLDKLSTYYQSDKRFLLLFKKIDALPALTLRVYNGESIWIQQVDAKIIDKMRQKSEVKGTYSSFCDMIMNSLEHNQFSLIQSESDLALVLQFRLARDVYLKGVIEMGAGMTITNDEDTRRVQASFTFDLFEALKCKREAVKAISAPIQTFPQASASALETKTNSLQPSKRKVNADIVRPNQKKRKAVGAKLG